MEEAVTPLPMPERTPPVTTTILRSEARVFVTRVSRLGGRWLRKGPRDVLEWAGGELCRARVGEAANVN